jgi:hypothetical protein
MDKNMMTALDPRQSKTEGFRKCDHLIEPNVLWARQGFLEQLPLLHRLTSVPSPKIAISSVNPLNC